MWAWYFLSPESPPVHLYLASFNTPSLLRWPFSPPGGFCYLQHSKLFPSSVPAQTRHILPSPSSWVLRSESFFFFFVFSSRFRLPPNNSFLSSLLIVLCSGFSLAQIVSTFYFFVFFSILVLSNCSSFIRPTRVFHNSPHPVPPVRYPSITEYPHLSCYGYQTRRTSLTTYSPPFYPFPQLSCHLFCPTCVFSTLSIAPRLPPSPFLLLSSTEYSGSRTSYQCHFSTDPHPVFRIEKNPPVFFVLVWSPKKKTVCWAPCWLHFLGYLPPVRKFFPFPVIFFFEFGTSRAFSSG